MHWVNDLEQELRSYLQVMGSGGMGSCVLGVSNHAEIQVGTEGWEKVSMSRDMWQRVQAIYPTAIFRFQHVTVMHSEMLSWLRVWGEKIFYAAGGLEQIRLSTIVALLLAYLKEVQHRVEVAVSDVNQYYITVLVRDRVAAPSDLPGETLVMTIPMQPSH